MKPVLKVYAVKMRDGSTIHVMAYTHGNAMDRAEIIARKDRRQGKGKDAAKAELVNERTY